jgi:hypothetical protein
VPRVPWWAAIVAASVLGAGVGAAVAAAGHVQYKAEADVVVQAKGGPAIVRPLLPNLRELGTSSILAGNVDSTLRLPGSADSLRKRLHASIAPSSQVIVLSVTDRNRERARQIAQEAAVVFAQLVQARFRSPALKAAVLDPAHVVSHRGRHFVRDPLLGAAIGFVLALAGLLVPRRGLVAAPTDEKLAERERRLEERIHVLSQRERALAKRAGELAKREQAVQAREAEARRLEAVPPKPTALEPKPAPAPVAPDARPAQRRPGAWNLNDLERLVASRHDAPADRLEEWRTYLFFLRDHAGIDGELPSSVDSLVEEVFADLVQAG